MLLNLERYLRHAVGEGSAAAPVEHCAASGVHALDDQVIQNHLLLGALHNVLLHTALGHQPVHGHLQKTQEISDKYILVRNG
jgi:hypothetical protein